MKWRRSDNFRFVFPHSLQIEFIYCGNVLDNDAETLEGCGIRSGTMIHVYHKEPKIEHKSEPVPPEQIQKAVVSYRQILKELAMNALTVCTEIGIRALKQNLMRSFSF